MKCPHCKKKIKKQELSDEVVVFQNTQKLKLKKIRGNYATNVNVFIGKRMTRSDLELFIGKDSMIDLGAITIQYRGDPFLSQILRDIGVFPSISIANGSGWKKKAELGFTDMLLDNGKLVTPEKFWNRRDWSGAKPKRVTILKSIS